MIRYWYLYLFLLLCFPFNSISQPVSNSVTSKEDVLLPGAKTSIPFGISNNSADTVRYKVIAKTSLSSITAILSKGNIEIAPFDKAVYIVPISVSNNALRGEYKITIELIAQKTERAVRQTLSKSIFVGELRKVSLTRVYAPAYLKAGDTIRASFLLANDGNTLEPLQLVSNGEILAVKNPLELKPGTSKVIQVIKATSAQLGKNEAVSIRLSATTANDNQKQQWTAYSNTMVFSTHPEDNDAFLRLPITASLTYINMKQQGRSTGGFQGEIFGKGSLREDGLDKLEFHAVSPSPIRFNSFSKYEEYYVDYENRQLYLHIGDKPYSSSYLTEYYRYGRGAELQYTFNGITVGGFYNHPRFFHDIQDEFNVFSKFRINKGTYFKAGYLYKTPNNDNLKGYSSASRLTDKAQLPYATISTKLFDEKLLLETEAAYSHTLSENGTGYRLHVNGHLKGLNGDVQYLKASPHFNGYFKNSNAINANFNYRVKEINFSGNYNQDARNIRRDTLYLSAPISKSYQLGLTYAYVPSGDVSIFGGKRRYEDRLEPRQFDYLEKFARLSVNQQFSFLHVNAETQLAKTANYLTGLKGNSIYYTVNLGFEKWNSSFNLYGSYANTSRYLDNNQKIFYYGGRLLSRFSQNSFLSLFYQNDFQPEEYYRNRNLFEVQYHQELFGNQSIEISGRYTLQQGQLYNKDYILSIKYIAQINLPVKRVAAYTTLHGTVQNYGVKQVNGVRVWLGNHSTVTDAFGNFMFKNLVPGNYTLDIDRGSIGLNDIPMQELPASLKVGKEANEFNIGLTSAAKISGKVVLNNETGGNEKYDKVLDPDGETKDKGVLILEASHGTETYRQICKLNGDFTFIYLRPGSWTLKVFTDGLDKNYKVLDNNFNFDLNHGDIKHIMIQVVKKQVKIKFQEGDLKVSYDSSK